MSAYSPSGSARPRIDRQALAGPAGLGGRRSALWSGAQVRLSLQAEPTGQPRAAATITVGCGTTKEADLDRGDQRRQQRNHEPRCRYDRAGHRLYLQLHGADNYWYGANALPRSPATSPSVRRMAARA